MARIDEVRVEYGRTVTDGNYGSERLAIAYTAQIEDGEVAEAIAARLVYEAREAVTAFLKHSEVEGVRLALETPQEREARWARELAERNAR
jgi:hypothetical protein